MQCDVTCPGLQMGIISKLQERYESPWGMQRNSATVNPFEAQRVAGIGDRRHLGKYDARFHSTTWFVPFIPSLWTQGALQMVVVVAWQNCR